MTTDKRIRVFSLLIDLLQRRGKIGFQEMCNHLETHDLQVGRRAVERYLSELRNLGVLADCDRRTRLYSLREDAADELNRLLRVIHLINSSDLLLESLKNRNKTLSCFACETCQDYAGSSNLEPIYSAIIQSQIIAFDHENFEKGITKRHIIKPYLLKEYNNKWYLVGTFTDSGEVRIFGLDRMDKIELTGKTFEKTEQKRILGLFDFLIGLVYDLEKPTTVTISVTPGQAKYFKKSPLHATQEIVSETEKETIFSYRLIPNRELQRLILGYSSQVKVLQPAWFVRQIQEQIEEMAQLYRK